MLKSAGIKSSLWQVQQRYGVMILPVAAAVAALLMAGGYRAMGKGLMLGVLFSVINFSAMAMLLPFQFNPQRNKSILLSFGSILLRFGLMAVPLVVALKSSQFALSTVVVGLFGVQIAILGDHLWARLRDLRGTRH